MATSSDNKENSTETEGKDNYYLELSSEPVKFEPVNDVTDVFFDDSKQQVFAIRSGGVTGVLVKGPEHNINFRMDDKGPVISIKFSPNMNILAIQRSVTSVEFINYNPTTSLEGIEYSQPCKGKNATILGFVWTCGNEILFVTDHGVELLQVIPEKRYVKSLKSLSLPINWFIFCPQSQLVLLSSGTLGTQMQVLYITHGNLHKITKFEMEALSTKPGKLAVSERDVALAVLYGIPCIIVLRHQPSDNCRSMGSAFVYVYTVHKMVTIKKSHILKLDMSGRFAINVVDNLIIVHHQASQTSMVFDIMLPGVSDGTVIHHTGIVPSKSIKPCSLKVPGPNIPEYVNQPCQLYSPNWVVFQPNIIIDAKLGCLWYMELKLDSLVNLITDKVRLVEFLMQRKNSKQLLIQVIKDLVTQMPTTLIDMPAIFDKINVVYRNHLENEIQSVIGTPIQSNVKNINSSYENSKYKIFLDQSDMYGHILSKFPEDTIDTQMIIWVLLEYIRSVSEQGIPVQHYLHELIITTLVNKQAYYQLHQLLQYHVVSDSKPLACLLLSLENLYPAAHQLALDMLKRLGNAHEEIIEVLLSKGHILPALRYIRSVGKADQVCARKFLEAAKAADDPTLFYSVYKFFEQRNVRLHNTTGFAKSERCSTYVQHFKTLFQTTDNGCNSDTMSTYSIISSTST
ncbi:regulator of MON1-CCZ1 complex [Phymastichus coffea]|uniref:regulator of MON1-CCZ1 complex n=1 Tax=Phymastichus coffea TaxID=108790 RepID=UPI00273A83BC|nr:regulator of MON1-CCZ1 complex [Phymastichus coffea]XP_058803854.1 regulator of MON1-CCZ1 complex [Phymastichus coffea]